MTGKLAPDRSIPGSVTDSVGATPLIRLPRVNVGSSTTILAKLEFLNPFGSAKDRVALHVVPAALQSGALKPGGTILESTSGNFGIALASVALSYGVSVTCVVDPNIQPMNRRILQGLGARLEVVGEPDQHGNYLEARLRRVRELLRVDPSAFWVNQYQNRLCIEAHYRNTAGEVLQQCGARADVLLVGVSTGATLVGLGARLREAWPDLRVCAVDAVGSSALGGANGPRTLPGLGMSRRSQLIEAKDVDEVIYVSEHEAIRGCRALLSREGLLAGASSGAVIAAAGRVSREMPPGQTILTVLPDRGERYLTRILDE